MAKGKSSSKSDKFSVGQEIQLVALGKQGGWYRANGELGVVVGAKRYCTVNCGPLDGGPGPTTTIQDDRYLVRWKGGDNLIPEECLRAIYDGEKLSSWERLAKLTGIRIDRPIIAKGKRKAVTTHG